MQGSKVKLDTQLENEKWSRVKRSQTKCPLNIYVKVIILQLWTQKKIK